MSQETREKILAAATQCFADSDSRGVSLRAIARAADVNSALIHYHFGDRESLFEAVLLDALSPVQSRRHALIQELRQQGPGPASARDLARLFIEPLLPRAGDGFAREATQLRLLARAFNDQRSLVQDLTLKHFGELMYVLGDLLGEALPHLPPPVKHRRMRLCVQTALETLSGAELDIAESDDGRGRDALVHELLEFLAGGLEASHADLPD